MGGLLLGACGTEYEQGDDGDRFGGGGVVGWSAVKRRRRWGVAARVW